MATNRPHRGSWLESSRCLGASLAVLALTATSGQAAGRGVHGAGHSGGHWGGRGWHGGFDRGFYHGRNNSWSVGFGGYWPYWGSGWDAYDGAYYLRQPVTLASPVYPVQSYTYPETAQLFQIPATPAPIVATSAPVATISTPSTPMSSANSLFGR